MCFLTWLVSFVQAVLASRTARVSSSMETLKTGKSYFLVSGVGWIRSAVLVWEQPEQYLNSPANYTSPTMAPLIAACSCSGENGFPSTLANPRVMYRSTSARVAFAVDSTTGRATCPAARSAARATSPVSRSIYKSMTHTSNGAPAAPAAATAATTCAARGGTRKNR